MQNMLLNMKYIRKCLLSENQLIYKIETVTVAWICVKTDYCSAKD